MSFNNGIMYFNINKNCMHLDELNWKIINCDRTEK